MLDFKFFVIFFFWSLTSLFAFVNSFFASRISSSMSLISCFKSLMSSSTLDDPNADMTTKDGKLLLGILALVAEFENDIRKERQLDGIAKAKSQGVKFGRKVKVTEAVAGEIRTMRYEKALTIPAIMDAKKLSKAAVYRALKVSEAG